MPADYTKQAAKLRKMFTEKIPSRIEGYTYAEIAEIFGVGSASTAQYLLKGKRKPRREIAIRIASSLQLADPYEVARLYGYDAPGEDTPVSLTELIEFAAQSDAIDDAKRADIIDLLHAAEEMHSEYDRAIVATMLRTHASLLDRAMRIAQYADMANSFPLLQVA